MGNTKSAAEDPSDVEGVTYCSTWPIEKKSFKAVEFCIKLQNKTRDLRHLPYGSDSYFHAALHVPVERFVLMMDRIHMATLQLERNQRHEDMVALSECIAVQRTAALEVLETTNNMYKDCPEGCKETYKACLTQLNDTYKDMCDLHEKVSLYSL